MAYAPNSISAGAPPQTPLGELTALPQTDPLAGFEGPTSKGGEGSERGGDEMGRGGRRREGRGGLSGNVAEEAFCLKSAPDSSFSSTIYSFFVLCLEHHYCGDQQWRSLTYKLNPPSAFVYIRWSWSCYFGLGFKNLVLCTSLAQSVRTAQDKDVFEESISGSRPRPEFFKAKVEASDLCDEG